MKRPLKLYMEDGRIVCAFNLYLDAVAGDAEDMKRLLEEGVRRMEGRYDLEGGAAETAVELDFADRFSLGAVNVKVTDVTPVIRAWYDPGQNVSRAYLGAGRRGILKLIRFVWRRPDVYINLSGGDPSDAGCRSALRSVIQHEFGHVLGFSDKYKYREGKFLKRGGRVRDDDIMYRAGGAQKFMPYHIQRLKECAVRGKIPFRRI